MMRRWGLSGPGAHHWAALGCVLTLPTLGVGPAWLLLTGRAGWRVTRHLAWMVGLMAAVGAGAAGLAAAAALLELVGADAGALHALARGWAIVALAVPVLGGALHALASTFPPPPPPRRRRRLRRMPAAACRTYVTGPTDEVLRAPQLGR